MYDVSVAQQGGDRCWRVGTCLLAHTVLEGSAGGHRSEVGRWSSSRGQLRQPCRAGGMGLRVLCNTGVAVDGGRTRGGLDCGRA